MRKRKIQENRSPVTTQEVPPFTWLVAAPPSQRRMGEGKREDNKWIRTSVTFCRISLVELFRMLCIISTPEGWFDFDARTRFGRPGSGIGEW